MEHRETEDQRDVLAFLSDPATHGGAETKVISTHCAHVILAGERAYKIKRAVDYDYLDFSTREKRRATLERELSLNAPAAPGLYLRLGAVTQAPGGALALDGAGEERQPVLVMRRFPAEAELARIAEDGRLTVALAERLGHAVARYHAAAETRIEDGAELILEILEELNDAFAPRADDLGEELVRRFRCASAGALAHVSARLSERGQAGFVRRCHGDLHLGNLVLLDGEPTPFDALEFDERLGTCDVIYDVAFLLMDLMDRGLVAQANAAQAAYLFETRDDAGLAALPLFLSVRAAIRAMVNLQTAEATDRPGLRQEARRMLRAALAYLSPAPACLIAVGGRSGTGKSTLARTLAPEMGAPPGAVHLRSDTERKAIHGVAPDVPLPPEAYSEEAGAQVYRLLFARAATLLAGGRTVILDATFLSPQEREAAAEVAAKAGVCLYGLWLEAPQDVLAERVSARQGDPSDADAAIVAAQMERDVGPMGDWVRVPAGRSPTRTLQAARAALHRPCPVPA